MLQKFKITTCAFILCLFGLPLMTVSPVFADDSIDFVECQQIKPNRTSYALMKEKKNCFRDLALSNHALIDGLVSKMLSLEPEGRGRDILSQDNILKAKFGVDQAHLDDQFKVCQKIKPKGKSYALMKEKKNCFRDIARESLLTIALVVTEIEEQIVRLDIKRTQYANGQEYEKFTTTDLGTSLQAMGAIDEYVITTEEAANTIANGTGMALSNAVAWVGGIFGL
jgi:hypothetical protein